MKRLFTLLFFAAALAAYGTDRFLFRTQGGTTYTFGGKPGRMVAPTSAPPVNPLPDNLWTSCVLLLEFPAEATTTNFTDSSPAPTYNAYSTNANTAPARTATNDGGYVTGDGIDDVVFVQTNKSWNQLANNFSVYAFLYPQKEAAYHTILSCGGDNVVTPGGWYFQRRSNADETESRRRKLSVVVAPEGLATLSDLVGNTTIVCSNWYGFGCSGNGTQWQLYVNGTRDIPYTTNNTTAGLNGDWLSQCPIGTPVVSFLSAKYDGTIYFGDGHIGFLAVFDRVLSTNEFLQLHNLRKARFGL